MSTLLYAEPPFIQSSVLVPEAGTGELGPTTAPTLQSVGQASGIVVASVRDPDIISVAIASYTLYRATSPSGPWTAVDSRAPSPTSRYANLFDESPLYGTRAYYYATAGAQATDTLFFIANASPTPIAPGGTLSAGAFGPYPLLGSDVYVDAMSGEGVIGPNGDLRSVNGLDCLAQDLRTRITTEQGELLLHPSFGMTRQRLLGSGQSAPVAQAQALQARFIDVITSDPRVSAVNSLSIARVSWEAWAIDVSLTAIGSEDEQRLNLVFPFYAQ